MSAGVFPPARRIIDLRRQVPAPRLPGPDTAQRSARSVRPSWSSRALTFAAAASVRTTLLPGVGVGWGVVAVSLICGLLLAMVVDDSTSLVNGLVGRVIPSLHMVAQSRATC